MLRFLGALLTLSFIVAAPAWAAEPEQQPEHYVKLRILPEYGTITPGQEIWVGIEQSIYPHWHTYWKNPGDSGAEPRINWDLPDGFTVSDIFWPVPEKIAFGPLMNYGYENQVILLQKLKAPDPLPEGPITLTADIEVLVCNVECIPEFGTYSVTLNDPAAETEDNRAYLETALAKLPVEADWTTLFYEEAAQFVLEATPQEGDLVLSADPQSIEFIPLDWGVVKNPAVPAVTIEDGRVIVKQDRDTRPLSAFDSVSGLITFEIDGARLAKSFTANPKSAGGLISSLSSLGKDTERARAQAAQSGSGMAIFNALILAFFGGIILNLMPCVFPVLSIKALSLIKLSDKERSHAQAQGFAYTAGVVLSFLIIAGALIALQGLGAEIGWGFQLQNPLMVSLLAYLLFVIGLNLSGFFEISPRFSNFGQNLTGGNSLSGAFFTGILATLVATPCTAPFMAAAIGFALTQSALVSLSIFAALGFGLAAPYLLLCLIPALQKRLPRPGAWMDVFKQFLAFPMFASSAWMMWVVSLQSGSYGVLTLAFGFVFIAFGIWLWRHSPQQNPARIIVRVIALALIVLAVISPPRHSTAGADAQQNEKMTFGQSFSQEKLDMLLAGDTPVFVEMTAAWCITCKVNQAVALNVPSTKELLARENVAYLVGDWTNQDPAITKYLTRYGRSGVPLYVFYGRPDANGQRPEAIILPQLLTPAIVADAISGSPPTL
jgi:thiol:disulfide interchange protein DsbD